LPAFISSFAGSMDYIDYSGPELHDGARHYLGGFFGDVRGTPSPASCLIEENGVAVAAALVKQGRKVPLLDALFVVPSHQRRGLAMSLLCRAAATLHLLGESQLRSYCLLGNDASVAFHQRAGFREQPDHRAALHRARTYRFEWARHRQLGDLSGRALDLLGEEAARWELEEARLTRLLRAEFDPDDPDDEG
jgi:GNAT superfamily N-acetyltransferase